MVCDAHHSDWWNRDTRLYHPPVGEIVFPKEDMISPNKPAAPNPAIASGLQAGHHWRGVGEPERSAASAIQYAHPSGPHLSKLLPAACTALNSAYSSGVRFRFVIGSRGCTSSSFFRVSTTSNTTAPMRINGKFEFFMSSESQCPDFFPVLLACRTVAPIARLVARVF